MSRSPIDGDRRSVKRPATVLVCSDFSDILYDLEPDSDGSVHTAYDRAVVPRADEGPPPPSAVSPELLSPELSEEYQETLEAEEELKEAMPWPNLVFERRDEDQPSPPLEVQVIAELEATSMTFCIVCGRGYGPYGAYHRIPLLPGRLEGFTSVKFCSKCALTSEGIGFLKCFCAVHSDHLLEMVHYLWPSYYSKELHGDKSLEYVRIREEAEWDYPQIKPNA